MSTIGVGRQCLIIGGSGYLGVYVVHALLRHGWKVRVLDMAPYKGEEADKIDMRVGSLLDEGMLAECMAGCETVLHLASIVDVRPLPGPNLRRVNVDGTRRIIEACKRVGVRALIYTSSMDVLFDGTPMTGGAYDDIFRMPLGAYAQSKHDAELIVLEANSSELRTCSIRPGHIYGKNDLLFRIALQNGKLISPIRIGSPPPAAQPKLSFVSVYNVAHAHALAANELVTSAVMPGQAYMISEGTEINTFDYTGHCVKGFLDMPTVYVPVWLMMIVALLSEIIGTVLMYFGLPPPLLTRLVLMSASIDHYFNYDKAKRHFNYRPVMPFNDTVKEVREWLREYFRQHGISERA